jgi:hypothetical protein
MVFVYLRDGQRLEVGEGTTFAHRGSTLICLNKDGEEVKRFDAHQVTAYGHVAYPYDPEFVSRPLDPEEAQPTRSHRRRRRRLSR